jgi:uncharacterized membrane protein
MRPGISLLLLSAALLLGAPTPSLAQTTSEETPVVHTVIFFSPSCSYCELVIQEHLPGVFDQFGGSPTLSYDEDGDPDDVAFYLMTNGALEILMVDVSVDAGSDMYMADIMRLAVPDNRSGVPRVDIAETYLVGSSEIPGRMPGIIEEGLASGGLGWPEVPGIEEALASIPTADGVVAVVSLPSTETVGDRFAADPLGNSLAVAVLVGMIASLVLVSLMLSRGTLGEGPSWMVPVFAGIGIIVSIYLAQVETTGAQAVCGPVGDCNAVQQSEYASIFGIPIGILGIAGYLLLIASWIVSKVAHGGARAWGAVGVFTVAIGGTLFSVYLTFLEPFVIGATCMWCLTSALCITGLLWASAGRGWEAFGHLRASTLSVG